MVSAYIYVLVKGVVAFGLLFVFNYFVAMAFGLLHRI